jgi:hypothetical protein
LHFTASRDCRICQGLLTPNQDRAEKAFPEIYGQRSAERPFSDGNMPFSTGNAITDHASVLLAIFPQYQRFPDIVGITKLQNVHNAASRQHGAHVLKATVARIGAGHYSVKTVPSWLGAVRHFTIPGRFGLGRLGM